LPALERGRNLEGQHNSKCDVKNHLKSKSFRCNTYKNGGGAPLDLPTFGRSDAPTPFLSNFYGLGYGTGEAHLLFFQSLVHSFPRDGGYTLRLPNLELILLPIPAPLCPLFSITYELKISQALYFQIHPCRRANVRHYPQSSYHYLITSSVSPSVPLQPKALGATINRVARILHDPGKQLRSSRCLRIVSGHRGQFFLGPLCKSCLRPGF
jgi:hypothetical protein